MSWRLSMICAALAASGCHDWDALHRVWPPPDAPADTPTDASMDAMLGCSSVLVANGDFEQGIEDWGVNTGASLTRATGHGGGHSGHVCSGAAGGQYQIHDVPPTVASAVLNQTYTLTLWAKPGAMTERLRISLEELSTPVSRNVQFVMNTIDWTSVVVTHVIGTQGSALSIVVEDVTGAASSECFDVDDICLTVSP